MALILFVDDDPYTLETMTKAAEVLGHRAVVADSYQAALAVLGNTMPDLIFTDMNLTGKNGISLVQEIKGQSSTAGIPVIILSASPEVATVEEAQAAGALAYLNKPVRLNKLQEVIEFYTTQQPGRPSYAA
jgi:CheY-like chemotaxis protein